MKIIKLLAKLFAYSWWWSRIGGRPWTWVMRDHAHENPFLWMLMSAGAVTVLANALPWWAELGLWAWGGLTLLLGHLFWGSRWIQGEGRKPPRKGGAP